MSRFVPPQQRSTEHSLSRQYQWMANPFSALLFDDDSDDGIPGGAVPPPPPPPGGADGIPFGEISTLLSLASTRISGARTPPLQAAAFPTIDEPLRRADSLILSQLDRLDLTPEAKGALLALHVHRRILSIDLSCIRIRFAIGKNDYINANHQVGAAVFEVSAARVTLDEVKAWTLAGGPLPPHLAPLAVRQDGLSEITSMLSSDVEAHLHTIRRLITKIQSKIEQLEAGRDGARARVGDETWANNATRPGWVPCDPAQRLAALRKELAGLEALRGKLEVAEVELRRQAEG